MDSDGKIIQKFANWEIGEHTVRSEVDSVEYVDGPAAHNVEIHDDYRDE